VLGSFNTTLYSARIRLHVSTENDNPLSGLLLFSCGVAAEPGHGFLILEDSRSYTTTQHSR